MALSTNTHRYWSRTSKGNVKKYYGKRYERDTNENYSLYSSHSTWNSKDDFINWTKSEGFGLAHKNAAQHRDLYLGPPDFEGFEIVF